MKTVLSHIVRKHLASKNEDIATEALNYIISSNENSKKGLINLLKEISPDLRSLQFEIQNAEENIRPDMCGYDEQEHALRVFIENKFWAGFTDAQPTEYLKRLSKQIQPTILLFVVPEKRVDVAWRDLCNEIENYVELKLNARENRIMHAVKTEEKPYMAITSWKKLLEAIEAELTDDPDSRNDFLQLRSLCNVANEDAFIPLTREELTSQRYPAFVLQISSVAQKAIKQLGRKENGESDFQYIKNSQVVSDWEQIGQYIIFPNANHVSFRAWFGIHFNLWKNYGETPLWLIFWTEKYGTDNFNFGYKVKHILEPWAQKNNVLTTKDEKMDDGYFAVGIKIPVGEESDEVVESIKNSLKAISKEFSDTDK